MVAMIHHWSFLFTSSLIYRMGKGKGFMLGSRDLKCFAKEKKKNKSWNNSWRTYNEKKIQNDVILCKMVVTPMGENAQENSSVENWQLWVASGTSSNIQLKVEFVTNCSLPMGQTHSKRLLESHPACCREKIKYSPSLTDWTSACEGLYHFL